MALTLNANRRSGRRQGFRKLAYQAENRKAWRVPLQSDCLRRLIAGCTGASVLRLGARAARVREWLCKVGMNPRDELGGIQELFD